jgi:dolichyl-phosphate beta-glucosyltransferase
VLEQASRVDPHLGGDAVDHAGHEQRDGRHARRLQAVPPRPGRPGPSIRCPTMSATVDAATPAHGVHGVALTLPVLRAVADGATGVWLHDAGVPPALAALVASGAATGAASVVTRSTAPPDDPYAAHLCPPARGLAVVAAGALADAATTRFLSGPRPGALRFLAARGLGMGAGAGARFLAQRCLTGPGIRRAQAGTIERGPAPGELRLSVVIPAYEEEPRIGRTVRAVRAALADLEGGVEVVVVDDGSSDGTPDAARAAGADLVVVHPVNRGKGAAVRSGVAQARGRTVAFTDADLSYPPEHLLAVLEAIEGGGDIAMGNRRAAGSESEGQTGPLRRVGSLVFKWSTRAVLVAGYGDTQSGIKAFRSDVAHDLFGVAHVDGFAFDTELLHVAERRGYTLREVPVRVVHSTTSTIRLSRHVRPMLADLARVRLAAAAGRYDGPAPKVGGRSAHPETARGAVG